MPMSLEETKSCVTLLLSTCPHPCRLRKLLRDFRKLKGHNMPLFGCESHLELLKTFTDTVMVLDSGNERNPEIRLIRREPLHAQRAREMFADFDDSERDMNSFMPRSRSNNLTLQQAFLLQDEAAALMYPQAAGNRNNETVPPEEYGGTHDGGAPTGDFDNASGGQSQMDYDEMYANKVQMEEYDVSDDGRTPTEDNDEYDYSSDQTELFNLIDDGFGAGAEEEEHSAGAWDVEDVSASFIVRLCVEWLMESFKAMWHRFTRSFGWFRNNP